MAQLATRHTIPYLGNEAQPALSGDMRKHLGTTLRQVYEQTLDRQPIPDSQIDLLLQLRHKERDRQRND